MIIDLHCHYTFTDRAADPEGRFAFEPARENPWRDACVSPRMRRGLMFGLLRRKLGLRRDEDPDRGLERVYQRHLLEAADIDRFVLLAFDLYRAADGSCPPLPQRARQRGSDVYTSNSFVRAACRVHPDRYLFGASVHPYRPAACDAIEEVFAGGACLLKWLPLHQNIEIDDPRTERVLACCARLGLPVLVHYGPEFTLTTNHWEQVSIVPLLETLRRLHRRGDMPTVIVAHCATPTTPLGDRRDMNLLLAALRGPLRGTPLYADISALTTPGKAPLARWLAQQQDLHHRMLFGSDFPVPVALPFFARRLSHELPRVRELASWPAQALAIFRAVGFGEIVFRRAAELLPNLNHFAPATAGASEMTA